MEKASEIEEMDRQMEKVRSTADKIGWDTLKITSREQVDSFDPLVCPDGSVLVMHIKERDGSADHSISVCRGFIFDANRKHALPLAWQSLHDIGYDGIVSATLLTPKKKIAEALARKRKRCE